MPKTTIKPSNQSTNKTDQPKQLVVFAFSGRQFSSYVGETILADKLDGEVGSIVKVTDLLNGKTINLKIQEPVAGDKIKIIKFKNKSRYMRHMGHRQKYTRVLIESLS